MEFLRSEKFPRKGLGTVYESNVRSRCCIILGNTATLHKEKYEEI